MFVTNLLCIFSLLCIFVFLLLILVPLFNFFRYDDYIVLLIHFSSACLHVSFLLYSCRNFFSISNIKMFHTFCIITKNIKSNFATKQIKTKQQIYQIFLGDTTSYFGMPKNNSILTFFQKPLIFYDTLLYLCLCIIYLHSEV